MLDLHGPLGPWKEMHGPLKGFTEAPLGGAVSALGRSGLRLRLHRAGALRARTALAGRRHRRRARGLRLDHGFARRLLTEQQVLDLVARQRLEFEQALGQNLELGALGFENPPRLL